MATAHGRLISLKRCHKPLNLLLNQSCAQLVEVDGNYVSWRGRVLQRNRVLEEATRLNIVSIKSGGQSNWQFFSY